LVALAVSLAIVWDSRERTREALAREESARKSEAEAHAAETKRRRQMMQAVEETYTQLGAAWVFQPYLSDIQQDFLRKALRIYQELSQEQGTDPSLRSEAAHASYLAGLIQWRLGSSKEAEKGLRRALDLQRQLADAFPDVPSYRQELARTHSLLGTVLHNANRPKEAEGACREAVSLGSSLVASFRQVPDYRRDLALYHLNLGFVLMKT